MLNVNSRAILVQSSHFVKRFKKREHSGLILLSSIVDFQGVPNSSHYAATKAYVQALAERLHVELAPLGIDVLASSPGSTRTCFASRARMTLQNALEPNAVARETLDALGKKVTLLPGVVSKAIVFSLAVLPRWMRVWVMGQVMQGMVNG